MKIEHRFMNICDRCPNMKIESSIEELYADDKVYDRTIVLSCERERSCFHIYNFLASSSTNSLDPMGSISCESMFKHK